MTKTKTITLYSFQELPESAKQKAIENLWDINVDYSEWDNSIEDANEIGLKIISLDDHRSNKGEFITTGEDCANLILENHGKDCETYKTAKSFLDQYLPLKKEWDEKPDPNGIGGYENAGFPFEYENQATELSEDFLHSILEDYRVMRNQNYEYLTSSEAIIESIQANEYLFNENGEIETL